MGECETVIFISSYVELRTISLSFDLAFTCRDVKYNSIVVGIRHGLLFFFMAGYVSFIIELQKNRSTDHDRGDEGRRMGEYVGCIQAGIFEFWCMRSLETN